MQIKVNPSGSTTRENLINVVRKGGERKINGLTKPLGSVTNGNAE